jgi:NitT/TauT family transport system substrate-binding protein
MAVLDSRGVEPARAEPAASARQESVRRRRRGLAVLREAMEFRTAKTDETIKLTAKMLSVPEDQVRADAGNVKLLTAQELDAMTKDGTIGEWLGAMDAYFVQAGKLKQPGDPKTYYTGDLFTAAAQ